MRGFRSTFPSVACLTDRSARSFGILNSTSSGAERTVSRWTERISCCLGMEANCAAATTRKRTRLCCPCWILCPRCCFPVERITMPSGFIRAYFRKRKATNTTSLFWETTGGPQPRSPQWGCANPPGALHQSNPESKSGGKFSSHPKPANCPTWQAGTGGVFLRI